MKKTYLFVLAVLLAGSSFSQKSKPTTDNPFKNSVYVRFGYGFVGGPMKTEKQLTAAGQFEVGSQFYLNSINLPEQMKFGIDVNYLSATGMINRDSMSKNNEGNSYFTAGVKVGPCYSYNFAPHWIADVYFKLTPNYFITGESKKGIYNADKQFKLGTSFGFNVRYKVIMIGCEFTSAKYDFKETLIPANTSSKKLPVSFLSIGVDL